MYQHQTPKDKWPKMVAIFLRMFALRLYATKRGKWRFKKEPQQYQRFDRLQQGMHGK